MKQYTQPEMDVIVFDADDIITASGIETPEVS